MIPLMNSFSSWMDFCVSFVAFLTSRLSNFCMSLWMSWSVRVLGILTILSVTSCIHRSIVSFSIFLGFRANDCLVILFCRLETDKLCCADSFSSINTFSTACASSSPTDIAEHSQRIFFEIRFALRNLLEHNGSWVFFFILASFSNFRFERSWSRFGLEFWVDHRLHSFSTSAQILDPSGMISFTISSNMSTSVLL